MNAIQSQDMELLKAPEPLLLSGNTAKNWKRFKPKFKLFLEVTAPAKEPRTPAVKTALLLSFARDEALFNNFSFEEGESKQEYATLVKKFAEYCHEQQNEVFESSGQ